MSRENFPPRYSLPILMLFGAVVFCAGVTWGLPSREIDRFLFGTRTPWTGRQILDLAGDWPAERHVGADVDSNPVLKSDEPRSLNRTDEQRAQILLRYRLYTYQPDEMITFRSLGQMHPGQGDLDPRLYQYGGFWIYPVGAAVGIASKLGFIHLTRDKAYYLDHPEAFARFYIVARLYSALWGILGIAVVYRLALRLAGNDRAEAAGVGAPTTVLANQHPVSSARVSALLAAAAFLCLPVVINMAHEAKPHLPAAVMSLVAILCAVRFTETGRTRWWVLAGAGCGLAFGTVLSALPVFAALPLMVMVWPAPWNRRLRILLASLLIGGLTYAATNPYVLINLFFHREVLFSNLGNSTSMYRVGGWNDGVRNTFRLLLEAASPVVPILGLAGGLALLSLRSDRLAEKMFGPARDGRAITGLLLGVPAALSLFQFCALAAGKPGEYGRFLVFPSAVLVMAIGCSFQVVQPAAARRWQIIALAAAAVFGGRYLYAFVQDTRSSSRLEAAAYIAAQPAKSLIVHAEPAPYVMPPFDVFTHSLILDPSTLTPLPGELLVVAADDPDLTRRALPADASIVWPTRRARPLGEPLITWADKPILVIAAGSTR